MSEFDEVDVPVTVSPGVGEQIADDLASGDWVTLRISADDAPELEDQIRWQIENEQLVTELVDDYAETAPSRTKNQTEDN